jgi:CMP-N-acetylneuraminic acid synthetase
MKYIIPARKGSKGLKHKNRYLFDYTAKTIPANFAKDVYVTSDDEYIIDRAKHYRFNILHRKTELSADNISIKHVLQDVVQEYNITEDITMLYLTYPKRTWQDIMDFYRVFMNNNRAPTVCKKSIINHPYLCFYEMCDNKGKQVIEHDLYRRQDYPSCFQICHFLFSCRLEDLDKLNLNLYHEDMFFHEIDELKCLDIDTQQDFQKV